MTEFITHHLAMMVDVKQDGHAAPLRVIITNAFEALEYYTSHDGANVIGDYSFDEYQHYDRDGIINECLNE